MNNIGRSIVYKNKTLILKEGLNLGGSEFEFEKAILRSDPGFTAMELKP